VYNFHGNIFGKFPENFPENSQPINLFTTKFFIVQMCTNVTSRAEQDSKAQIFMKQDPDLNQYHNRTSENFKRIR